MSIDTGQDRVYNENYPIAGAGQSSQQFRDNFAVIKAALESLQSATQSDASILTLKLDTSILDGSVKFTIGYPPVSNVAPSTIGTLRYNNGALEFWNGAGWAQLLVADGGLVNGNLNFTRGITAPRLSATTFTGTTFTGTTFVGNAVSARSCVAQRFDADDTYPVGTVVIYGGDDEVTVTSMAADPRVAGVVVDAPGYTLDDVSAPGAQSPYVALLGRASCFVSGPVEKGDILVTSETPGVAIAEPTIAFGAIIGKSLETKTDSGVSLVSISVQRC